MYNSVIDVRWWLLTERVAILYWVWNGLIDRWGVLLWFVGQQVEVKIFAHNTQLTTTFILLYTPLILLFFSISFGGSCCSAFKKVLSTRSRFCSILHQALCCLYTFVLLLSSLVVRSLYCLRFFLFWYCWSYLRLEGSFSNRDRRISTFYGNK